jgi:AcrR family transcriptional regulator
MVDAASAGRSEPRPRRADARRNIEAILDAATRTLAANPRASMQEVAEAAGVHRATVHRHFAMRDDLLAALQERALQRTLALVQDPEIARRPAGDALAHLTRALLEAGDRERTWRISPPFGAGQPITDEFRAPLLELFHRGQREGALREDLPARVLASVWGGLLLSQLNLLAIGEIDLDGAVDVVSRLLRA